VQWSAAIMTMLAGQERATGRRAAEGLLFFTMLVLISLGVTALGFVGYAMWPRWPDAQVAADAPALPVVVGGVLFNVPPQAIRVAVQRRAGPQERVDLVYLWPSLAAPDPTAVPKLGERDRVFVTIAAAVSLPPVERLKTIYPRYTATEPNPGPQGIALFAFRDGTPYQGEDLVFDATTPEKFLARCARTTNPLTPATCLAERRIGDADVIARFPREWLENWREVEAKLDDLIGRLRLAGQ
jgi:hypothetical protein